MAKRLLSHAAVALFWLLHFLPLPLLATLGRALGRLLLALGNHLLPFFMFLSHCHALGFQLFP